PSPLPPLPGKFVDPLLPGDADKHACGLHRGNEVRQRLLRPCHKRPRGRRAAEQHDELAPFHSITSSARAIRVGGRLMPSACAVLRLTRNSKCVGNWSGMSAGRVPRKTRTTKSAVVFPLAPFFWPHTIKTPS